MFLEECYETEIYSWICHRQESFGGDRQLSVQKGEEDTVQNGRLTLADEAVCGRISEKGKAISD